MIKQFKRALLLFIVALLPGFCLAQIPAVQKLFPVWIGEKCGYIDEKGGLIVPYRYDSCNEFKEGFGAVLVNNKYGFINTSGQLISQMKFENYISPNFSEGVAPVTFTNEHGEKTVGYIDRSGRILQVGGVDKTYNFSDGMAKIEKNGLYGYIDKTMKIIIRPRYTLAQVFSDGLALVVGGKSQYFIDKRGKKRIDAAGIYDSFSEGLVQIRDRFGLYGFLDTNGTLVISNKLSTPSPFSQGLAASEHYGKWGYINKSGEFVIKPQFESAEDFSVDGYAVVGLNGKFGLININGEIVLSPVYDSLEWLSGLARVKTTTGSQYVNLTGKVVWASK